MYCILLCLRNVHVYVCTMIKWLKVYSYTLTYNYFVYF